MDLKSFVLLHLSGSQACVSFCLGIYIWCLGRIFEYLPIKLIIISIWILHFKIEWLFILFFVCHDSYNWSVTTWLMISFQIFLKLLEHYICWHNLISLTRYWMLAQVIYLIRMYWWPLMKTFILYLFLFHLCLIDLISATNKIWGSSVFRLFSSAVNTGLLVLNDESVTRHGPGSPVQWQPGCQSIFSAERNELYPQMPPEEEF